MLAAVHAANYVYSAFTSSSVEHYHSERFHFVFAQTLVCPLVFGVWGGGEGGRGAAATHCRAQYTAQQI